jgi:hypothetical protein
VKFPSFADTVSERMVKVVQIVHNHFSNLKQLYITAYHYGGYTDTTIGQYEFLSEPAFYYHNWGYKWTVEKQILDDARLTFKDSEAQAPWIAWGPNFWADGLNPREYDSLYWVCETDFSEDGNGYHLTIEGRQKEADMLIDFFQSKSYTTPWFLNSDKWISCDTSIISTNILAPSSATFNLYPSINSGLFCVDIPYNEPTPSTLFITNSLGEIVHRYNHTFSESGNSLTLNLPFLSDGLYYLTLLTNESTSTKGFVVSR